MARPTILIGIGSGGLRSIEAAWKLSQEIPSSVSLNQRPLVEYIFLETDESNKAASSDIVACPLTLTDINSSKHAVEQDLTATTAWVHNQNFATNVMNGAGGSPVVGRMTIWDKNNRRCFENSLNQAVRRLNEKSLDKPLVYIVGSFGGGTGSGTFLDIAYIVRDTLSNQVEVQGLFMIPNNGLTDRVIYSNTVCCIKELEYFNDENHEFPFRWNANPPKGYEKQNTPFDLVQIISAAYNTNLARVTYSQLHEEVGLFLYLNVLGLYDVRRKSLVDASGNIIVSKYTTYGLAALHYPEQELKEIVANQFASELLGNIADESHYFDKDLNTRKPIDASVPAIRNKVTRSFDIEFAEILHKWCDTITVVDTATTIPVEMHIESIAAQLASSNSSYDEKRKTLYGLFKVGGEYYKQLKNYCDSSALDPLVALITKEVQEALRYYQNINVAWHALDAIEGSITKILSYWLANGYKKDAESWNTLLKKGIEEDILPMPSTFKIQLESQKVYADRIRYELLYGLAMHIFSESLEKILHAIKGDNDNANNRIIVRNTQGNVMPSKPQLTNWKSVISCVKEDADPSYKHCEQVLEALKSKLSQNNNGNIEYLYPEGSLEATVSKIKGKYIAAHNTERMIIDVTDNDDLYQFLVTLKANNRQGHFDMEKDLYDKVIEGYLRNIDTDNFTVAEAIQNGDQLQRINLIIKKALIPHLPINPTGRNAQFAEHKNIPHILAGFDGATGDVLNNISKLLVNSNIQGFEIKDNDRDKLSHIGLNNWLIFFKEFGRMSDDRPFNIIDDLRDFEDFANYFAADMRSSGMSDQAYHEKRMPYLSFAECQSFAQKYITLAGNLFTKNEWEEAIKAYQYAKYWDMSNSLPQSQIDSIQALLENESDQQRFDRFYNIAQGYLNNQDYRHALHYYGMAEKIKPGDANIASQRSKINKIMMDINNLIDDGDQKCITANINYDRCVQSSDHAAVASCIESYREILSIYEQALSKSQSDESIKYKIDSINKRIHSLNNI